MTVQLALELTNRNGPPLFPLSRVRRRSRVSDGRLRREKGYTQNLGTW